MKKCYMEFPCDSKLNHGYNMVIGHDILSEHKIDLCFSDNKIRVNIYAK